MSFTGWACSADKHPSTAMFALPAETALFLAEAGRDVGTDAGREVVGMCWLLSRRRGREDEAGRDDEANLPVTSGELAPEKAGDWAVRRVGGHVFGLQLDKSPDTKIFSVENIFQKLFGIVWKSFWWGENFSRHCGAKIKVFQLKLKYENEKGMCCVRLFLDKNCVKSLRLL